MGSEIKERCITHTDRELIACPVCVQEILEAHFARAYARILRKLDPNDDDAKMLKEVFEKTQGGD